MIAVPSGPSARKAMMPPTINPGTVVCSHGVTGMLKVELPKPHSTGRRPVSKWIGGRAASLRVETRIRSRPGRCRLERSPNEPRTGSSQIRTGASLSIDTVVAQAVQADVWEVGQAVILRTHTNLGDQQARNRAHDVHRRVVAARRPQLGTVGIQLQHVRATAARDRPLGDLASRGEINDREGPFEAVWHGPEGGGPRGPQNLWHAGRGG